MDCTECLKRSTCKDYNELPFTDPCHEYDDGSIFTRHQALESINELIEQYEIDINSIYKSEEYKIKLAKYIKALHMAQDSLLCYMCEHSHCDTFCDHGESYRRY